MTGSRHKYLRTRILRKLDFLQLSLLQGIHVMLVHVYGLQSCQN